MTHNPVNPPTNARVYDRPAGRPWHRRAILMAAILAVLVVLFLVARRIW